jgi:hypothetical protein
MNSYFGALAYPNEKWEPVWVAAAGGSTPLLAAPSDSAMTWFRSARPGLYVQRPGYLKLGFDPERATGWSEEQRRVEAVNAFMHGESALCGMVKRRGAGAVLLRAQRGLVGLIDVSGGAAAAAGMLSRGTTMIDRNSHVVAVVPNGGHVQLRHLELSDVAVLSVWQALGNEDHRFELFVGHRSLRPHRVNVDGSSLRFDFSLPSGRSSALRLRNGSGGDLWLVRMVGFSDGPAWTRAPASVVDPEYLCDPAP